MVALFKQVSCIIGSFNRQKTHFYHHKFWHLFLLVLNCLLLILTIWFVHWWVLFCCTLILCSDLYSLSKKWYNWKIFCFHFMLILWHIKVENRSKVVLPDTHFILVFVSPTLPLFSGQTIDKKILHSAIEFIADAKSSYLHVQCQSPY